MWKNVSVVIELIYVISQVWCEIAGCEYNLYKETVKFTKEFLLSYFGNQL